VDQPGGFTTHWSLLYIDRTSGLEFKHFDSKGHFNVLSARALAGILSRYFGRSNQPVTLLDCPSQMNSYDCGVYVMAYIDLFLGANGDHEKACQQLTAEFAIEYRAGIRVHVNELTRQAFEE
jgi:Ulp1 family protease